MLKIPCVLMRAGTSKAAFILKKDLPQNVNLRDQMILRLMGSPDLRQIDGVGGGDPLSSKVAIIDAYNGEDADVSFLFAQVLLDKPEVNTEANCGNILSGVAPFVIEKGLVKATHPVTKVRIFNENTKSIIVATVKTPNGVISYKGDTAIDGVPGTSAPIYLDFGNIIGSTYGKIFPTGNMVDIINNIPITFIDVSIPVIFISAISLGKKGNESKNELDKDLYLLKTINEIRLNILGKLGVNSSPLLPKISLVSKPINGGSVTSRYFTPKNCHPAHAVTGALALSAACKIEGTIPYQFYRPAHDNDETIVEHPAGKINVSMTIYKNDVNEFVLKKAQLIRTARPLFEGNVLI